MRVKVEFTVEIVDFDKAEFKREIELLLVDNDRVCGHAVATKLLSFNMSKDKETVKLR